ncbi:peptidoglycan-binding domain-containing protein [Frankia sp. AgB32]|uniref:peptidoglycan-binding domain-containing protein n=1 Tax=Frankia sp. AgB32 TaxID=631119 RepID=UPI00200F631A|nr:peptidoglycan-binding domain-containing protein [Frankia sp. AgB32]MCK9896860.1 peptidoglycan-binding protein [Frankia sp. AgB32]
MVATLYPPANYRPVSNRSPEPSEQSPIVLNQGSTGSLYRLFNRPSQNISAHLWLSQNGRVEQYIPFDETAWPPIPDGPPKIYCILEGEREDLLTISQQWRLSELLRWGQAELGWPLTNIDGSDISRTGTTGACPDGFYRLSGIQAGQYDAVVKGAENPWQSPDRDEPDPVGAWTTLYPNYGSNPVGAVLTIQRWYNEIYANSSPSNPKFLHVNGRYDDDTVKAIKFLQGDPNRGYARVKVDGICGDATWDKAYWLYTHPKRTQQESSTARTGMPVGV